jgi:antitoxin component YwqK of YwqJK toxin-antitoxin module/Tfp pilus assembly protein PilF
MMKKIVVLILSLLPLVVISQETLEYIDPAEMMNSAREARENGNLQEALVYLDKISVNDSLYPSALYAKASYLFENEDYDQVINICQNYHTPDLSLNFNFGILEGVSHLRLEEYKAAGGHFEKMIQTYPKSYLCHYDLGLALMGQERTGEAVEMFQKSILYNPYYAYPHLQLAEICLNEGLLTRAVLSYNTYLLMNPGLSNSLDILIKLNEILSSDVEASPVGANISDKKDAFKEINLLLKNYVALNENFEITNKIDVALVRQNQLIMQQLKNVSAGGCFWLEKYVPFYKKLYKEGYFDAFVYRIMSSTTNEKYKKIVNKNRKREEELIEWITNNWPVIVGKNNHEEENIVHGYQGSGEISTIHVTNSAGEYHGLLKSYSAEGYCNGIGKYVDGKRDGTWKWYGPHGHLKEEVMYKMGTPSGVYNVYHVNGQPSVMTFLEGNDYQGDYNKFNKYGVQIEKSVFKDDKLDGITEVYHNLGSQYLKIKVPYEKGIINGDVKKFYPNGKLEMEITYKQGDRVGKETQYYMNGQVYQYFNYNNDGNLSGEWKRYYWDGTLMEAGKYENDHLTGKQISHYPSGKEQSVTNYNQSGEITGLYKEFDPFGNLWKEYMYDDGALEYARHYNKKGELINEIEAGGREYYFKSFHYNGNVTAEGKYLKNDTRDGEWKYYTSNGYLLSVEMYDEGTIVGDDKSYYVNGNTRSITPYKKGNTDGLYRMFHLNGQLLVQGHYKHNLGQGYWLYYYPDGTLSEKRYYKDDQQQGYNVNYSVEGKIFSRDFFEHGFIQYTEYYDTAGNVYEAQYYFEDSIQTLHYANGLKRETCGYLNGYAHGNFKSYHMNGILESKGTYFNGKLHGKWVWYSDKGSITREGNFFHGEETGKWFDYYDDGTLSLEKEYMNGKLSGDYYSYNKNGTLTYQTIYKHGVKHGEAKYFSSTGDLQMVRYYEHGTIIGYSYNGPDSELVDTIFIDNETGKIVSYYPNGKKAREFELIGGKFTGKYVEYFPDGSVESIDHYNCDMRNGESVQYYPNGKKKYSTSYLEDNIHGKYTGYYKNGRTKENLYYLNGSLTGKAEYFKDDGNREKTIYYFNGLEYDAKYY